jgi:hypothetical protein
MWLVAPSGTGASRRAAVRPERFCGTSGFSAGITFRRRLQLPAPYLHPGRFCGTSGLQPPDPARHKVLGWFHANPLKTNDRAMRSSTHNSRPQWHRQSCLCGFGPRPGAQKSPITNHQSRVTNHGLLIDTLAIRNHYNSLTTRMITFSNRHVLAHPQRTECEFRRPDRLRLLPLRYVVRQDYSRLACRRVAYRDQYE